MMSNLGKRCRFLIGLSLTSVLAWSSVAEGQYSQPTYQNLQEYRESRQQRQRPQRMSNNNDVQRAKQNRNRSSRTRNVLRSNQPSRVRRVSHQQQQGYTPAHLRNASHQAPIVGGRSGNTGVYNSSVINSVQEGDVVIDSEVGGPINEYVDDCGDCGGCDSCVVEECGTCGGGCLGGFCDRVRQPCGCGDIYNCVECARCFAQGFGGLICNTEWFAGAHAFSHIDFNPQTALRGLNTGPFGFHGGVNIGLPMRRLCGIVSGQIGASIYQSDFGGDGVFSNDTREQVFLTAGLFRRVDYGFQFGAVADILFEDWFYKTEMVQIRTDLSYALGNGSLLGFRFIKGVQDGGTGHPFGVQPDILDTYRFYARMGSFNGNGHIEISGGFSEESHGIIGAQTDVNLTQRLAVQSGFTYLWEDAVSDDGYNVYMRLVLRPAARNWYRNYHRPMFNVADNGSMITIFR